MLVDRLTELRRVDLDNEDAVVGSCSSHHLKPAEREMQIVGPLIFVWAGNTRAN